ncbi:anti-Muellerian hormone type-2 receptor [Ambystoma mexicanum]|uniref:anti-Muellerian hormone type-2 receptor n=1 Tax=Ambystoma mexicanum TaxID=8296 RepID=UPI0037E749B2
MHGVFITRMETTLGDSDWLDTERGREGVHTPDSMVAQRHILSQNQQAAWLWIAVTLIPLILLVFAIIGMQLLRNRCQHPRRIEDMELMEGVQKCLPELVLQNLSGLHVSKVLHTGSCAVIRIGIYQGEDVAIKSFPASYRKKYLNEWSVLRCMTPMNHGNIVRFIAAGCDGAEQQEKLCLLILQYHPAGSLRSYLIQHTRDWDGMMCMAVSLARGLAFLHAEIQEDGCHKPSIAHRDLSSQNVLVKADGTCAISDFDLALQLLPNPTPNVNDVRVVGTLRYMSPEILEGSVNLKCWELTLKQADVYSMGLLFWETFSRCSSFYPSEDEVPAFRMAYEAELGKDASFTSMWTLVFMESRRPAQPAAWNKDVEIYRSLWETLQECWDADAEARLTAMCTEQRLCKLIGYNIPTPQHQSDDESPRAPLLHPGPVAAHI